MPEPHLALTGFSCVYFRISVTLPAVALDTVSYPNLGCDPLDLFSLALTMHAELLFFLLLLSKSAGS
jgi:hypothetical protein